MGLFNEAGVHPFFAGTEADPAGSLLSDLRPDWHFPQERFVPLFPLDALSHLLPTTISIIKIDVEGVELEVVQGMSEVMRTSRPWITCEVLLSSTKEQIALQSLRNEKLWQLVVERRYRPFQIVKRSHQVSLLGVDRFNEGVWDADSSAVCDYLLVPVERLEDARQRFDG